MTSEKEALLDFALKWEPFGGAPLEDILVTFGMGPNRYINVLPRYYPIIPK